MSGRGLVALLLCTWFGQGAVALGQGLPNLKPFAVFGWPDSLVVHTNLGQPQDTSVVRDTQNVYVDWAVFNDGATAATNTFFVTVFVDDSLRGNWFVSDLAPGLFSWVSDGMLGKLNPGFHTIRLEIDSTGAVEESDETDNVVEQRIAVTSTNIIPTRMFDARATTEGSFSFSVLGSAGQRYQVEYSTSLVEWLPMETLTNLAGVMSFVYPIAPDEPRSYRVRLLPP